MPTANQTAPQAAANSVDMGYLLRLEPKLAVDYLKAKGYNITWNWHEQLEQAHARAFTVAKATRAEILETLRLATTEAIEQGVSERDFIKNLTPTLQKLGWWGKQIVVDGKGNAEQVQLGSPHRLRTILRTNKITAYHAGRYASQMDNADEQPYWQYIAIQDAKTRQSHLALHGKVFRYDDPIWEKFYPPNDWGCRCRVRALSEFRRQRQGLNIDESGEKIKTDWVLAGVDKATGEETHSQISRITTDKGTIKTGAGWNYNVGQAAVGTDIALIRKLQQIQNRELRQQTIQAINNSEARHQAFANWVKAHLGKLGASARYISAGLVSEDIAAKVAELSGGNKMSERVLVMTEKSLAHANSEKHHATGVGLTEEDYASISRVVANPSLVLWDKQRGHNNLVYINQDQTIKVIVNLSNKEKLKPKEKVDAVINTYKVDMTEINEGIRGGIYQVLSDRQ